MMAKPNHTRPAAKDARAQKLSAALKRNMARRKAAANQSKKPLAQASRASEPSASEATRGDGQQIITKHKKTHGGTP